MGIVVKESGEKYQAQFDYLYAHFTEAFLTELFPNIHRLLRLDSMSFLTGEIPLTWKEDNHFYYQTLIQTKLKHSEANILLYIVHAEKLTVEGQGRLFQFFGLLHGVYQMELVPIIVVSDKTDERNKECLIQVFKEQLITLRYYTVQVLGEKWSTYMQKNNPIMAAILQRTPLPAKEKAALDRAILRMVMRMHADPKEKRKLYDYFF